MRFIDSLRSQINTYDVTIEKLKELNSKQITVPNTQLEDAKKKIEKLNNEISNYKKQKEILESNLNEITDKYNKLNDEYNWNVEKLKSSENDLKSLKSQKYNEKISELNLELSEKDKLIRELNTKIQSMESKLTIFNKTMMDFNTLEMKYNTLNIKYNDIETKNKSILDENQSLKEKQIDLLKQLQEKRSEDFKIHTIKVAADNLIKAFDEESKAINQHTNTRCLLKEAELNHFEKEIQFLKIKLQDSYNQINILNYHLSASEKQLFKYDPDTLNQQRSVRKEAFNKLSKELEHVYLLYINRIKIMLINLKNHH